MYKLENQTEDINGGIKKLVAANGTVSFPVLPPINVQQDANTIADRCVDRGFSKLQKGLLVRSIIEKLQTSGNIAWVNVTFGQRGFQGMQTFEVTVS